MGSLNESLAALKAAGEAKRDPSATALMNQATEDLRASGILDGVCPLVRPPRSLRVRILREPRFAFGLCYSAALWCSVSFVEDGDRIAALSRLLSRRSYRKSRRRALRW